MAKGNLHKNQHDKNSTNDAKKFEFFTRKTLLICTFTMDSYGALVFLPIPRKFTTNQVRTPTVCHYCLDCHR